MSKTLSARVLDIANKVEITNIDDENKTISTILKKPNDDVVLLIQRVGFMAIPMIKSSIIEVVREKQILANPSEYANKVDVENMITNGMAEDEAIIQSAKQYYSVELIDKTFYKNYEILLDFEADFFHHIKLKNISIDEHKRHVIEFDALLVGVDPHKEQTAYKLSVCFSPNYIRYRKGTPDGITQDETKATFEIYNHDFDEDMYKLLMPIETTDSQNCLFEDLPENQQSTVSYRFAGKFYTRYYTGKFMPGDNVRIVGVMRHTRQSKTRKGHSTQMETWIDVIHVKKIQDDTRPPLSSTELESYKKRALADPDQWARDVCDSIAPQIHGNNLAKEGIVYTVLEGNDMGGQRPNILLYIVGDPQTGKSTLASNLPKILPKCLFQNGPAASARGLEYSLDDKRRVLTAGPLILNRLLILDEFDKVRESLYGDISATIEQQLATYAKGGHSISKKINCSMICLGNFTGISFDPELSPVDQFGIPAMTLSRFRIVRAENKLEDSEDRIRYIMKTASGNYEPQGKISLEKLGGIFLAQREARPTIPESSSAIIHKFHSTCEKIGSVKGNLTVGPRQLQDIMRFAKARAKLLFLDEVDERCIMDVINWFKECDRSIGIDTDTGTLSGIPPQTDKVSKDVAFWKLFSECHDLAQNAVSEVYLCTQMEKSDNWLTMNEARSYLNKMKNVTNEIYEPISGWLRRVN
ncbi:MAG: ATPase [Cenarchaeum symbiont of Oopsacas minuta]|nr:ATPase [Cenarchaeum symbiont of Oopsacas minuta]